MVPRSSGVMPSKVASRAARCGDGAGSADRLPLQRVINDPKERSRRRRPPAAGGAVRSHGDEGAWGLPYGQGRGGCDAGLPSAPQTPTWSGSPRKDEP
jgi:hypothetical protein